VADTLGFDFAGYSAFDTSFGIPASARLETRADGTIWTISGTDPDFEVGTWYTGVLPGGNTPADYEMQWIDNIGFPDPPPVSISFSNDWNLMNQTVFYALETLGVGMTFIGGFWNIREVGFVPIISNCFTSIDVIENP